MNPAGRMLYMLSLTGSHDSAVAVRRNNPFTGQDIDTYPPALTDTETADAKRVLARYGARLDESGRYVLQLSDGTAVEVVPGGESDGEPGRWTVSFGASLQRLSREVMQSARKASSRFSASASPRCSLGRRAPRCFARASA